MIHARHIPEAIQWHEGMLLAPQHFQQSSLRQEELLHYHSMLLAPFHWGIRRLRYDQDLLLNGVLRILDLEAVMPDGLVVAHPHGDGDDLEIDLQDFLEEMKNRPIQVFLAVPARKLAAPTMKGDLPRYDSVEGGPVLDENALDNELSIPRIRPKLHLFLDDSPSRKYVYLPLLKLILANETITPTRFVPPSLRVSTDSSLGEMCRTIAVLLRHKAIYLSEKMLSPSVVRKGPMLFETRLMIHGLVAGLPHFEALLNSNAAHPYAVYLSLCSVAGQIASLGGGFIPPVLPAYDHNDLQRSFERIKEYIYKMIEEGILVSHTPIPFDFEEGTFSLVLEPEWIRRSLVIGARTRPGMTEEEMVLWLEKALIGSQSKIENLKGKRVLGAQRKRIDSEGDLMPTRGSCLFSIDADPALIQPHDRLEILNLSDPSGQKGPGEIVLYLKN